MSRVFVIQQPMKQNVHAEFVPKFDIRSARQFGEFTFLLSPTAAPFRPEGILAELQRKLRDFSAEDYILLIGNPCFIGWTCALAAQRTGGILNLLQWSGTEKRYLPIKSRLQLSFPQSNRIINP